MYQDKVTEIVIVLLKKAKYLLSVNKEDFGLIILLITEKQCSAIANLRSTQR